MQLFANLIKSYCISNRQRENKISDVDSSNTAQKSWNSGDKKDGKISGTNQKQLEEHLTTNYSRLTGNRLVT